MKKINEAIKEFEELLEKHPDEPKSLSTYSHFIRYFLRLQTVEKTLPTVEIMTILKHKKPIVFTLLRKQSQSSTLMRMLTQVDIGLEEAEKRLHQLK